jgi:hypothetical protein
VSTIHVVKQGEWLQQIARLYGFASWRTLYDHPDNEPLRDKRPDPDLLFPGDEVIIPDKQRKDSIDPDAPYRVVLGRKETELLRFQPRLDDGQSLAGKSYQLKLGSVTHNETVPSTGIIEHPLAEDATQAELTVTLDDGLAVTWVLQLGGIDPIETLSGIQTRLRNLRYYFGAIATADGDPDLETQAAIRAFQKDQGSTIDGQVSADLRTKLQEVHGV